MLSKICLDWLIMGRWLSELCLCNKKSYRKDILPFGGVGGKKSSSRKVIRT